MFIRYSLPILAMITLFFAVTQMLKSQQKQPEAVPPIQPAQSPYVNRLAGAGIVEPETENIGMGTHVPGVVSTVFVKVGDSVKPNQPLFKLDDRQVTAELEIRKANLIAAEANASKLEMMPRLEELPPARAVILEAEANLKDQMSLLQRVQRLSSSVSEEEVMRRETAAEIAKAQLTKAKANLSLMEAGAWKADKTIASAAVLQTKAMLSQTQTELSRLTVNAPALDTGSEFKVLQVNIRPGEFVGSQPGQALIVLGCVGKLHVRVDIDESDIPRYKPNFSGVAMPRGNPNVVIPIKFVRVEPYVIPKRSLTGSSLERVDTRVLQVIYSLETKENMLFVGQQMEVFINMSEEKKDDKKDDKKEDKKVESKEAGK